MSLTSCIISPNYKDRQGYARYWDTITKKAYLHHRWVYAQHNNIDLDSMRGLSVMHLCDNPPCVNPLHLRLGTHQDNMDDKVSKGRHSHGTSHGNHKLTDADVIAIRSSSLTLRELAKDYGVSHTAIGQIKRGESYKHLL